jgi:hypothetical protein
MSLSAIACSRVEPSAGTERVARLTAVDTLTETDSLYVARVTRAYVAPDGHVFVSDHVQRRVLEFDGSGRLVRALGRNGDGPGEFRGPAAITTWGNDSLVVTDLSNRRISVFRRSDGEFLWHAEGLGSVSSLGAIGARLVVASLAADSFTTVGVIDPGRRVLRPALRLPEALVQQPLAIASFPRSVVAVNANLIVTAVLWSDIAVVHDSTLATQSTFAIPRRLRRPIPPDLDEALRPLVDGAGRLTLIPTLITIEVLKSGWLVFIHKDWIAPQGRIADPARITTEAALHAYATVVDLSGRRACTDVGLPTDWAENPHFISDGHTIVGIGHVVDESSRPTLERRRYDLLLDSCVWDSLSVMTP